ncbi:MAG TPA: hypothetical protein VMU82_12600, partial [Acetobacteraceae bacterium]|nr:hypothetical protein [Acetobacteraceae bacterium]
GFTRSYNFDCAISPISCGFSISQKGNTMTKKHKRHKNPTETYVVVSYEPLVYFNHGENIVNLSDAPIKFGARVLEGVSIFTQALDGNYQVDKAFAFRHDPPIERRDGHGAGHFAEPDLHRRRKGPRVA